MILGLAGLGLVVLDLVALDLVTLGIVTLGLVALGLVTLGLVSLGLVALSQMTLRLGALWLKALGQMTLDRVVALFSLEVGKQGRGVWVGVREGIRESLVYWLLYRDRLLDHVGLGGVRGLGEKQLLGLLLMASRELGRGHLLCKRVLGGCHLLHRIPVLLILGRRLHHGVLHLQSIIQGYVSLLHSGHYRGK